MDLFDKIGDIAKNVSDKAASAVGVGRLSVNIKTEQLKIDNIQKQIGAYCYERHLQGERFDPEIELSLTKIDEINKNIAALQAEMRATRTDSTSDSRTRYCSNCGAKLQPGSNFCNYCGTRQY